MEKMKNVLYRNKKRMTNLFIYFLGLFALKGVSLILTPLYTKVFSTSEYGIIELANSIVSFLSAIIGLGLCQYLGIEFFHFKGEERECVIIKNIKQYMLLAGGVTVFLCFFLLVGLIRINGLTILMEILIIAVSFLSYFPSLCFMLCKNQQKTLLMTIIQLIVGVITLLMNIMGVCYWNWGIYSTLLTTIISNVIIVALIPKIFPFNIKFKSIKLDYHETISVLRISIPLAMTTLINSILVLGDRWVLNYYCSTSEIGIYALATKISGIFELLIVNTLTIFYSPVVYKSYQNIGIKRYEKRNRKNFLMYVLVSGIAMAGFLISVKWIFPILIDSKYNDSLKYLWMVLIGEFFLGATYFRTYLINYKKKTKYILLINIVATLFNLITNIVFIPRYQIYAAAGTTAVSYFVMYVLATIINKNEYNMHK